MVADRDSHTHGGAKQPATFRLGYPIVAGLLAAYWLMAVSSVRQKSTTFDEMSHLTAGYSFWAANEYSMWPMLGHLPCRWAALPVAAGGYRFPPPDDPAWRQSNHWGLAGEFFHGLGNDVQAMLWRGRAMIALLGVGLGAIVWFWSRRLFGHVGGILSLTLMAFSPTMLAHGPLITSDMAAALFFTASVGAMWALLHRVSPLRLAASCLAMAGLMLSKLSAGLIVPMAMLLVAIRLLSGRPLEVAFGRVRRVVKRWRQGAILAAAAAAHVVVVLVVIWAAFGFRYSALKTPIPGYEDEPFLASWSRVLPAAGAARPALEFARRHRLLPEAYIYGHAFLLWSSQGHPAFFNGRWSDQGWWQFFPYSVAVKTPLALWAILLAAAVATARRWRTARRQRGGSMGSVAILGLYRTAPLWVLLAVYWAAAIGSNLSIGHRHILPTYPAMFILAGAAVTGGGGRLGRIVRGLVIIAVAAFAAESIRIRPHYLAYFNQLAGGPANGYKHLVDSSLDWGQDLPGLKAWLDRSVPPATPVYLSYLGTGSPEYYGIKVRRLPGWFDFWRKKQWFDLTGGVYCISATMLQGVYTRPMGPWSQPCERRYQELRAKLADLTDLAGEPGRRNAATLDLRGEQATEYDDFEQLRLARLCAYLRHREPDDRVGYSILIYRLSDRQVEEALFGPPAELLPDTPAAWWSQLPASR